MVVAAHQYGCFFLFFLKTEKKLFIFSCVYVPFNIRALHGGALQHALHGGWPYGSLAR